MPKADNPRVRYLKPDEVTRLFEALKSKDWLKSVVILARETGLRLTNICELTWSQVELTLEIKGIRVEKTKSDRPHWVPLSDAAEAELIKLNKAHIPGSDRVFMVGGRALDRDRVGRAFRRTCKRAKIEDFHFHDLRHDFCSRLVQRGVPLLVVMELAGHKRISTTEKYSHLMPENKVRGISVLNGRSWLNSNGGFSREVGVEHRLINAAISQTNVV